MKNLFELTKISKIKQSKYLIIKNMIFDAIIANLVFFFHARIILLDVFETIKHQ